LEAKIFTYYGCTPEEAVKVVTKLGRLGRMIGDVQYETGAKGLLCY
jgi:hypothetical protein